MKTKSLSYSDNNVNIPIICRQSDRDSVSVIARFPSIADGLATRIANEVNGETSEDKVANALECGENYSEFYEGVLIISDEHVGTIGKLPKIVETNEFDVSHGIIE